MPVAVYGTGPRQFDAARSPKGERVRGGCMAWVRAPINEGWVIARGCR